MDGGGWSVALVGVMVEGVKIVEEGGPNGKAG